MDHVCTVSIGSKQLNNLRVADDIDGMQAAKQEQSPTSERIRKCIEGLRNGNKVEK